ncbi:hypothetical protein TSOC_003417 [Tetrabaena socialis]|uniref:SET domain-containing protein n=1 Tax=Tetrabaena socialis TaxID=47790 RepID=A0A2J8ABN7_9CHLO|nr:hypothetical protein TSOC_003417 [Tetrabaena socialis]|eukprot:PNH09942.1 hypothetical protein TSOC_003417 [Tetrabaena socialis]
MRRLLVLALFFLGGSNHASAQPLDAIDNLFQWVRDLGGEINMEVRTNPSGVRGIFATKKVVETGYLASIPASAILNTGSLNDSFAVPTLTVLRELKDPHSRFKPYVDMWPKPDGLLNSCNLPEKYIGMWKSAHWEKNQKDWLYYLTALHEVRAGMLCTSDSSILSILSILLIAAHTQYTIEEMVGNATVTLDDLKYCCAISSTRYVSTARRRRLLMAPIFDLANHERECLHTISSYETADFLHVVAGEDVEEGQEICYSYGSLRDDYAVAHYGFLPALEDPPRLALVDHWQFDPESPYSHDDPPSEEPFEGTPEEMAAELARLRDIYTKLVKTPDTLPPTPKGQDYMYDLLKALEARRLNALSYEITRLSNVLEVKRDL